MRLGYTCLLLSLVVLSLTLSRVDSDVNGGVYCAGCTWVIGWLERLAEVNKKTIGQVVKEVCDILPEEGDWRGVCKTLSYFLGPLIASMLRRHETPDVVCHAINMCYTEQGQPQCHFYPLPEDGIQNRLLANQELIKQNVQKYGLDGLGQGKDICDFPGFKIICEVIDRVGDHLPALDIDHDNFSSIETLRGSDWRGRDCNDLSSSIHPGAKPLDNDRFIDSNCNGIYGFNEDGESYEDLFCADSESIGIVALGDSATAHFHIPVEWINPSLITKEMFEYLPRVVANEIDWPMMSAVTGFVNLTWPIIHGKTKSLYWQLRERNLCNHRDYQSISVNGARSSNMLETQLTMSRNENDDYPLLVIYSLLGNDVCNGHPDTLDHMTTPAEMESNLKQTMAFLEEKVPVGSHMFILGIADGRVLFNSLTGRIHPLGALHDEVTYDQFYDYMACLQMTPCMGWLQTNETLRNLTTERSRELNEVMGKVAAEANYSKFDVHFLDDPISTVFKMWEEEHGSGSGWMLIEAVDGFHPNQIAQGYMAEYLWSFIVETVPHFAGNVNPHNKDILDVFGDQGGH